ncbi:MAG TPA: hypothetical protein VK274_07200 [Pyrinomonadaceae bacterium]|nr:hypothetical protein [Pyrinomonadaceae bacterium]
MKKQVVRTLMMIGLLNVMAMVVIVGSVQAQSLGDTIRVDIPFDFSVRDKTLPAGEYSIRRAQPSSGDTVLLISSVNNHESVFPLTNAAQSLDPKDVATLVFHRYGDQYFLFQVWPAGATYGRVVVKSRSEREIERQSHYAAVVQVRVN